MVLVLQENAPLIGFAMASGVCIFFGNMGLMYSLCLAGVTIAVPLFSSFIVIVGEYVCLLHVMIRPRGHILSDTLLSSL